jgi:small subunit ribosomal protein S21
MAEVKLKPGQSVDSALRVLRKKLDREGTLLRLRDRKYYKKPSEKRQERMKKARFEAMLEARHNKYWDG